MSFSDQSRYRWQGRESDSCCVIIIRENGEERKIGKESLDNKLRREGKESRKIIRENGKEARKKERYRMENSLEKWNGRKEKKEKERKSEEKEGRKERRKD